MNTNLVDFLLIQSFSLDTLIEDYKSLFLSLLPTVFILACLVEYFNRLDVISLLKRTFIAILILTSVSMFYKESILASINLASEKLNEQKQSNILLLDLFDLNSKASDLEDNKSFYDKDKNILTSTIDFINYHLFSSFVNDGLTTVLYFITQLCLVLIKVLYSLGYYLIWGLIGIPCLLYIFPTMGNILRGAILSYVTLLIIPHILVFILSMIGAEIEKGYSVGQIIGGSVTGTALLFLLTVFIALSPFIALLTINGSGIAQASANIASVGAAKVMSLPRVTMNTGASLATGGVLTPKMQFIKNTAVGGSKLLGGTVKAGSNLLSSKKRNISEMLFN